MTQLTLKNILSLYLPEFDGLSNGKIRLVKHSMNNWLGFEDILRFDREVVRLFTAEQGKARFEGSEVVLSFVSKSANSALLVGAYFNRGNISRKDWMQIGGYEKYVDYRKSNKLPIQSSAKTFYDLEDCKELEDLCGRMVIEWTGRTFVQKKLDRKIIQILAPGFVSEFPGWENVRITFQELIAITENPEGNKDWYNFLSSHDGVYLIMDKATGGLYVGSATGVKGGIWGRWKGYARTKHNQNKYLESLIREKGDAHAMNFIFSLHHVFARGAATKAESLKFEALLKEKLGSRAFGLN